MMPRTHCFGGAIAALIGLCGACTDSSAPAASPRNELPTLVVSSPESGGAAASRTSPGAAISGFSAYVSLPPATVPDGIGAQVRNGRSGAAVIVPMVAGGFDPVAIVANTGDTIFVQVARASTTETVNGFEAVVAGRAPHVVRTSPAAGKKDVPINEIIVVVFSAPIDSTTMDTNSVKLLRGTTPVPGTVRFADDAHVRMEFHPDSRLVNLTDYQLLVAQSIRDVNGAALDSAVTVPFTTGSTTPPGNLVFSSVAVGFLHACGITTTGAAYCWGADFGGQLGTDSLVDGIVTPVPVGGGLKFASLSASWDYTCGVTTTGAAYCWGGGWFGADSTGQFTPGPVPVPGGLTFTSVSAGFDHACGVTSAGAAYCWGAGYYGELGIGPGATTSRVPVAVTGGLIFAQVSAGGSHSCGVTTAGAAYCWGQNSLGELGIGSSTGPELCHNSDTVPCSTVPAAVSGALAFATVSAGANSTCGTTTNRAVYCWGNDRFGLMSSATGVTECAYLWPDWFTGPLPCALVPLAVGGPSLTFLFASSEDAGACGLDASGAAHCWGQFGGTPVSGGLTFAMLSTGEASTCGVTTDGVAYCWGDNSGGELGNGTTSYTAVPVKVAGQP